MVSSSWTWWNLEAESIASHRFPTVSGGLSHPYLSAMSASEWMRLGYLHTDHHLRQVDV